MKKYCLIESDKGDDKQKLYQIQALRDFTTSDGHEVKVGDLGGFISGEHNLSQEGNCWVANSAEVWDQAYVSENAYLGGFSRLYDQAQLYGNARVTRGNIGDNVKIYGNAQVSVKGQISDHVEIFGNAAVCGKNTRICGSVKIFENARVGGNAIGKIWISDNAQIYGNAQIEANCHIKGDVEIWGNSIIQGNRIRIEDNVKICGAEISGSNDFFGNTRIIGENIVINDGVNLGSNAFIQSQNDFLQTKIFSDFLEYLTAYKTENGFEIRYNNEPFSPTQIRNALKAYSEYETAIKLAKSRILGGF
ncbi:MULTISPECIES: hypothetical protein [Mannheimia]|uniref:UDP-3-O-[3-hydroxymyristoyl] glucosamine N-acyltransferase n=1 Tax=Mannheimia pernigra TaxID=111844 RepID=A0ABD7A8I0_9PAST|nr:MULTISPECIES: hypothetical protein [Mannheimia]QLB42459.1 hypothetical protein HV560_06350 [Mannheimia pernigra]QTM00311.1 hypothetical protein GM698_01085 [Mannheimia sp. ZY171111]